MTRKPCRTESDEQRELVDILRARDIGCFSVPNGAILGGRNKWGLLTKLRAEGMLAGAPDVILMDRAPDGRPIAVEMKRRRGGSVTPEQRAVHAVMKARGWVVVVARGAEDAIEQLRNIGLKPLQNVRHVVNGSYRI
jgi:hypothetical protein